MLDRSAALINYGRYYTPGRDERRETRLPYNEASEQYRRRIQAGDCNPESAAAAAEFLFFSGRRGLLQELSPLLLRDDLVRADTLAYCAYARAETSIPDAMKLLQRGLGLFPGDPKLPNDILRLQFLSGLSGDSLDQASAEGTFEGFAPIASSIYLLFFLQQRDLIAELPPETSAAVRELAEMAATPPESEEALLLQIDYSRMIADVPAETESLDRALKAFPGSFEVLAEAVRFGIRSGIAADEKAAHSYSEYAETILRMRPWQADGYNLQGELFLARASHRAELGLSSADIYQKAVQAFERSIAIEPEERKSWIELFFASSALFTVSEEAPETESVQAAVGDYLKKIPSLFLDDPRFTAEVGRNIFESGMEAEGESLIRRAAAQTPSDPMIHHAAGIVAFTKGLRSETRSEQEELLNSAVDSFRSAYNLEEDTAGKSLYLITLASVYSELKDQEKELAVLLEGAAANLPDEELYLRISELYHTTGDPATALRFLEQGYSILPESADLGIEIARCYSRDSRFEESLKIMNALLQQFPNTPWIWNQMGIIHVEWGNYAVESPENRKEIFARALHAYDQARRMAPEEFTYHSNYGDALRLCGELDAAEKSLREALRLNPQDAFSMNALGLVFSERARHEPRGEKQESLIMEAERVFQQAAMSDPGNPIFDINLADLYYDLGYFEDAIDVYQRIIETSEDAWQYYDIVGLCYYHTGNLAEAAQWFRLAMEKEPQAPEVANSLGLCCLGSGKISEAIEYFKQASLLDPENPVYLDNIAMAQYNQIGYATDLGDSPRM